MKFTGKILSLLLASLMLAAPLTACKSGGSGDGTGTDLSTGTTAGGESETLPPRHDYMAANVSADVTLPRESYTNLILQVPNSLKVEAEDVKDYVENIRFQNRVAVNGTTMVKDKPLALGDDAYIYYKGFLNGEAFEGGSNWDDDKPYTLGLGSGSFIPGFEEALVGVIPNTTSKNTPAEITVTFPEDYNEELGGKEVIFQIAVEYAVQYTLPEYNREFVEKILKYEPKKDFYASDAAFLEEFEAYVYDYLVDQTASKLTSAKNTALWDHLLDVAACKNLPATEVGYYYSVYYSEVERYYETYKSYNGEQFTQMYPDLGSFAVVYLGLESGADWKDGLNAMAEELVRRDMITHAIAEQEGLETVTDAEFDAQVEYWIDYYKAYYGTMTREQVLANIGEAFLKEAALSEKINARLMEQVAFTYEDGTPIVSNTDKNE